MSSMTHNLSSPAMMIANVPGLLGFYPHESLVVLAFDQSETSTTSFNLTYVSRLDIEDTDGLDSTFAVVHANSPDLVWVVFVSDGRHLPGFDACVARIDTTAHDHGVAIDAGWALDQITTGAEYELVISGTTEPKKGSAMSEQWVKGRVGDVSGAYAVDAIVRAGESLHASREEVFNTFAYGNPLNHQSEIKHKRIAREAKDKATAIRHGAGYFEAAEEFQAIITAATIDADKKKTVGVEAIMASKTALTQAAVFFGAKTTRDLVMAFVPTYPEAVRDISLAVARSFHGFIRENALCVYALAMVQLDAIQMAVPAVRVAIAENPRHELADILSQGFFAGIYRQLLASCVESSHQMQAHCVRTHPSRLRSLGCTTAEGSKREQQLKAA